MADTVQKVDEKQLQTKVSEAAEQLEVPGVAVGVYLEGEEQYAFHGVTSLENPLPVDENTLFQFGSTGKTYTATAIMRLVERGDVDLNEKVRKYVPELKLKDEDVARNVTVLHLLNHTAGWSGDLMKKTGDGDDALEKYVESMVEIDQVSPLGTTVSYNNASLSVAGLIISKATGQTYEAAIKELIFEPIGLNNSYFFPNEIMTRRFAVGHNQKPDGSITVARPWALPRGNVPAGGISSNAEDQIKWARFHLGDGRGAGGKQVLSRESLDLMKKPTFDMRGSAIGDYVGITWLIREVDGVRLVGHGGTTNGQHSEFITIPERDFAIAVLSNSGPNGAQMNHDLVRWALEAYLGVIDKDPEPITLGDSELTQYAGTYDSIHAKIHISTEDGALVLEVEYKPEMLEALRESGEDEPPDYPPFPLGILPPPGDNYIVTGGPAKGMKGYFVRDESGDVQSVHVGGRLATKVGDRPG